MIFLRFLYFFARSLAFPADFRPCTCTHLPIAYGHLNALPLCGEGPVLSRLYLFISRSSVSVTRGESSVAPGCNMRLYPQPAVDWVWCRTTYSSLEIKPKSLCTSTEVMLPNPGLHSLRGHVVKHKLFQRSWRADSMPGHYAKSY